MEKFKYDIFTLIEAVENKSCLWDKSSEQYKDKVLRKNSWRFVCKVLKPEFDNFEMKVQEEIMTIIMNKWTHVRDSFIRSMKTKSGQGTKRKYVYAEYMHFLLKNKTANDTESSIQSVTPTRDEDSELDETNALNTTDIPKSINKRKNNNNVDKEILNAIRSASSPTTKEQPIDEDNAFLLSLLPTLKKIPEDDKMDFRIEVMQLLNKYSKRNRNRVNNFSYRQDSPHSCTTQESVTTDDINYAPPDMNYAHPQEITSPPPHQQSDETPECSYTYIIESDETQLLYRHCKICLIKRFLNKL